MKSLTTLPLSRIVASSYLHETHTRNLTQHPRRLYTTKPTSDSCSDSHVSKDPNHAMGLDQHGSFGSSTSCADIKSPPSDAESDDSFGSSIFDGIDDLTLLEAAPKSANTTQEEKTLPVSESKSSPDQDSVKPEEESEAPYTVGFTIPSPPPRLNGRQSDPPLFWSHKLYRGPKYQSVAVHYCDDFDQAEALCKEFLGEKVVGFDMEWESKANDASGIKKNISVIQVASEAKVGIFHIAQFSGGNSTKELIPPSLIALIESPEIIKTGVAVYNADGTRIKRILRLNPRGLVELSHFFNVLQNVRNANGTYRKTNVALNLQVETYLKCSLPKGPVRTSSWSLKLNRVQIDYAASDAYAGLMLYHVMNEERKKLRPTPPHPHFAELLLPIEGAKEKQIGTNENDPSSVTDSVIANATTESGETVELLDPAPVYEQGPQAEYARQQAKAVPASAKEASEYLLRILTPSEPCLEGWSIGFTSGFTCLQREQVATLVKKCGGKFVSGKFRPDTLVIVGSDNTHGDEKSQLLLRAQIPAMAETDFYHMIRFRHLTEYPTIEKPSSWEGKSLEAVLTELVQSAIIAAGVKEKHGATIMANIEDSLKLAIGAVCTEKPRRVIDLKEIEGGLFLYTFLKLHGHDVIQILHTYNAPAFRKNAPSQKPQTEMIVIGDD